MSYDDKLHFRNGFPVWDFSSFTRQACMLNRETERLSKEITGLHGTKIDYLQAQRELLEADVECEFRSEKDYPALYLNMHVRKNGRTLCARAVIFRGVLTGVRWERGGAQERFRHSSGSELAAWLHNELEEVSYSFCTVIGG